MGAKGKKAIRKQEILETFYRVLLEKGLEGSSIANIANHMGIHPSLIIHYFKTKDDLLVELVEFCVKRYDETYVGKIEKIQDPRRRLKAFIDMIFELEWIKEVHVNVIYACYYLSLRNERIHEHIENLYYRHQKMVVRQLKAFIKAGIVKRVDPVKTAEFIICLAEGLFYYDNILRDDQRIKELGEHFKKTTLELLTKRKRTGR